ncbi:MarR family transcriptional regulator [Caulobacter segnis]
MTATMSVALLKGSAAVLILEQHGGFPARPAGQVRDVPEANQAGRRCGVFHIGPIEDADYTELDVLATLRRAGAPYRLSPTALRKTVLLTSGAMTACLNRLDQRGLIRRSPTLLSRRSLMAMLTTEGVALIETAIVSHFAQADQVVARPRYG